MSKTPPPPPSDFWHIRLLAYTDFWHIRLLAYTDFWHIQTFGIYRLLAYTDHNLHKQQAYDELVFNSIPRCSHGESSDTELGHLTCAWIT